MKLLIFILSNVVVVTLGISSAIDYANRRENGKIDLGEMLVSVIMGLFLGSSLGFALIMFPGH